jgi:hypothetical protein
VKRNFTWLLGVKPIDDPDNPPGRPQNKKYRPELREPHVLTGWLDKWEEDGAGMTIRRGRYCGYSGIDGVQSTLKRVLKRAGIEPITPYSFRHKVTTIPRLARVPEDEIAVWEGHKRPHLRTTGGYGEWSPDYLANAAVAIDAWFARVQPLMERPFFSQGIPKTIRVRMEKDAQVLAGQNPTPFHPLSVAITSPHPRHVVCSPSVAVQGN